MPEIFVQISDPANPEQYKVITGLCLLVRSPAFHPYLHLKAYLTFSGDIRVVKAVDCDDLLHLVYLDLEDIFLRISMTWLFFLQMATEISRGKFHLHELCL
jgi:hypothetical protein